MKHLVLTAALLAVLATGIFGQCPGGRCPAPYGGSIWQPAPDGYIRGRSGSLFRQEEWGRYRTEEAPPDPEVPPPDDPPPGWRGSHESEGIQQWHSRPPEWLAHVYGASGMLVAKGEGYGVVLTAYHVVKGGPRQGIQISFPSGERHSGTIFEAGEQQGGQVSADKTFDLALIRIPEPKAEPCYMALEPPDPNEPIYICGYGGGRYRFVPGRVRKYTRATWTGGALSEGTMLTTAVAIGGDSGGAYVNSAGELCGVLSCSDRSTYSFGPGLPRIHALCTDSRFEFPFGFRQKTREELKDHEGRIEKVESIEIPAPPPLPAPKPYDDGPLTERVTKLETKAEYYDKIVEEVKAVRDELAASKDAQSQALAAAISKVDDAIPDPDTVEAAAKLAAEQAAGTVARTAAEKAVEEASPRLLERAAERVKGLVPTGLVEKFAAIHAWLMGHTIILVVLVIVFVVYCIIDIVRWIKTGGKDELLAERIFKRVQQGAEATRNPLDNLVLDRLDRRWDAIEQRIMNRFGPQPAAPPPVPTPPQGA